MAETSARFGSMDALRGAAILGILLVNIVGMGGSLRAEEFPPAIGWSPLDQAVWWVETIFIEGTMRGLLSLLFGASFILMLDRLEAQMPPWQAMFVYYRRALWLVLFGLFHAYVLLWPGDILMIYGLAAFALYPMRDWPERRLLGGGLIFVFVMAAMMWAASHFGTAEISTAADAAIHNAKLKTFMVSERAARLGDYSDNARFMSALATQWNLTPWVIWWVVDAFALMLVGAALAKYGVLQARAPILISAALAIGGYAIGLPLKYYLAEAAQASGFAKHAVSTAAGYQLSRSAITIGHAGAFLLLWHWLRQRRDESRLLRPLVWIGRLALTNYIGQTIIGQFILFSGFGLSLFGRLSWAELLGVSLCIWAVQITLSGLYLRRFRIGPLEWLWRRLSHAPLNTR